MVVRIDPLERADAIYVLGGTRADRALEAYDLFHAGYAPRIVMSGGGREAGELVLERRATHVTTEAEIMRDILTTRLGVPADAIEVLPDDVRSTAQEAEVIQPRIQAAGWRRLIVITDCATTRRAAFAFRRASGGSVAWTLRCSRYDGYDANRWWATRLAVRQTMVEVAKLIAYWLGLRG